LLASVSAAAADDLDVGLSELDQLRREDGFHTWRIASMDPALQGQVLGSDWN
jgi:hypothetical protein